MESVGAVYHDCRDNHFELVDFTDVTDKTQTKNGKAERSLAVDTHIIR